MPAPTIACIGGAHVDRHAVLHEPSVPGSSNPASVQTGLGGVARNVAQNLKQLGCRVLLCSRVGDDEAGRLILSQPIDTLLISISRLRPTASYTAILEPDGELLIGVADMNVYDEICPAVLEESAPRLREAILWFLDANLPGETLDWLLGQAGVIPVGVDAISVAKSRRLLPMLSRIPYLFCNLAQAGTLAGAVFSRPDEAARALRTLGATAGVVTAGANGIAAYHGAALTTMPAIPATLCDVTGAGDALAAGTLYGLARGLDLFSSARLGLAAAAIALESPHSSAPQLTAEALYARA